MLLGCGIQGTARIGDGIAIPMTPDFAHSMVVGQGSSAGQDLVPGTVFNGLEKLHGIGDIQTAEAKVKVDTGTSIVGLGHPARDGVEGNTTLLTFLEGIRC